MSNGQYSISKVEYPLLGGLAAHNYLAVFDPAGNVIHEFHGLAVDKNGIQNYDFVRFCIYSYLQSTEQ